MIAESQEFRTPGQLILALLADRDWTQKTLAIVLGMGESAVNRFVADKTPVDAELALALEEVFGVPADHFLRLQKELDLAQARITSRPDPGRATRAYLYGDLPISEMIKRGWITAGGVRDVKKVETELMRFFGVNRPEDIEILPHAAKKTVVSSDPTPAQMAWLYRVRSIAKELMVGPFSTVSLNDALKALRPLMIAPEEARKVPRILAEAGIRFVIVESLAAAKIDGVCFWLDDHSPVIGLSMRHDRIDNFWFVLRHELEHVRLGHGRATAVMNLDAELEGERAGSGPDVPAEERAANEASQEYLVPSSKMDAFIARKAPFFAERDLSAFATILGVHPGVVAGQLQHRTDRYDRFRQYLVSIRENVRTSAAVDGWGDVYPLTE